MQVKDIRVQEKQCEQKFYIDSYKTFDLLTKGIKATEEKLFKEHHSATKKIEELNESFV